jgi:arylsulfatase A-like enzyme
MTGIYSDQTKITQNNVYLRNAVPDVITMGQRFRQQGYQSVRIGKIFHYDNPSAIGTSGTDDIHTWDQTINPYGRDKVEEYKINTLLPRRYGGTLSWLAAEGKDEEQTDGIGASEAINQLENFSKNGQNFFLALGFYRPHTPYVAPKKYFDLYERSEILIPNSGEEYLATLPLPAAKSVRAKKVQLNLEEELAKEIKEAYYATTSFVDAQLGRVLEKLKQTGLDKNTIVVFTSDHGYHLGEHGHWQKQTLFENATRVPLIFSVPWDKTTIKRTNSPVELIDIYPTIMDLLDITIPKHVVGKSLKPLMLNNTSNIRNSALTKWQNGYSIKTEQYRITKWGENGELGYELYNHLEDHKELNNLANDTSKFIILDSLKKIIDDRINEVNTVPDGIGRQFINAKALNKAPNLTYGDLHNEKGKRTYFKEKFTESSN